MFKGVNKEIIEINKIDNPYFERAILFISPDKHTVNEREKKFQANRFVKKLADKQKINRKYYKFALGAVKVSAAMAVGAVAASCFFK